MFSTIFTLAVSESTHEEEDSDLSEFSASTATSLADQAQLEHYDELKRNIRDLAKRGFLQAEKYNFPGWWFNLHLAPAVVTALRKDGFRVIIQSSFFKISWDISPEEALRENGGGKEEEPEEKNHDYDRDVTL